MLYNHIRRTVSSKLLALSCALALSTQAALAEAPKVAAGSAPVHSLVARVMQGVAAPSLLMTPGASPHDYSLRPSQAAALQEAEIVVWTGPELTPWLGRAMDSLADDALVLTLLDAPGTVVLEMREDPRFESHDEDHEEHGARDPHAWLMPQNAVTWLDAIADTLAEADPANAELYRANAAAGGAEIAEMEAEIAQRLAPVRGGGFIVFHDAYQYFEVAFDMPAAGAISVSDASDPGPARLAAIRERVAEAGVACVLSEPQFNRSLVDTVLDDTAARTAVIDPLGSGLEPGPALYPRMMRDLAEALAGCL